jgi:diadenylate cyclase
MERMTDLIDVSGFFRALHTYGWWRVVIELFLIGAVVIWIGRFVRGTRGSRMLKGIAVFLIALYLIVSLLGTAFGLDRIKFLFTDKVLPAISLAVVVVFQPELRRALMRLGETRLFRGLSQHVDEEVEAIVETASFCSKRKIGALIAIERDVGLGGIVETGTRINSDISAPLLNTIFFPNTELHDLGVVLSQGRIAYAGVQFPLAESDELERELGSRHRAAVGLSQESDAVVVVVSEETGDISVAERGHLTRKISPDQLREMLMQLLGRSNKMAAVRVVD